MPWADIVPPHLKPGEQTKLTFRIITLLPFILHCLSERYNFLIGLSDIGCKFTLN